MGELSPAQAVYVSLASSALTMSVIGNFCVIYVIMKNKHLHTPTNFFISNLAASDIFMGGILLPQNVHDISHTSDYNEGLFLCKVITMLPILCITCSIFSLMAMAVERYRAICTTSPKMSLSTARIIMIVCWVGSCLVSLPTVLEYGVYMEIADGGYTEERMDILQGLETTVSVAEHLQALEPTVSPAEPNTTDHQKFLNISPSGQHLNYIRVCGNEIGWTYGLVNGIFLLVVAYVLPLIVISVCYGNVVYFIIKQSRQLESGQGNQAKNFSVYKNRVRIVKMLVVVAALFAISWCPYFVILLTSKVRGTDGTGEASGALNLIKLSLSIFSVSYNIYIYLIYTESFRTAFTALLCARWRSSKVKPAEGSTSGTGTDTKVVTAEVTNDNPALKGPCSSFQ